MHGVESGNRPDTGQPVLQSCVLPPPCPDPLNVLGLRPPNLPPFLPKWDVSPLSTFLRSPCPPVLQGCVSRAEQGAPLLCVGSHESGRATLSFPPGAAAPASPPAAPEAPPAPETELPSSAATVSPWPFALLSVPLLWRRARCPLSLPAAAGCAAWGVYAGLQKKT